MNYLKKIFSYLKKNKAPYKDYFCPHPFVRAEIFIDKVYCCCPALLNVFEDCTHDQDISKIWNSQNFQKVRKSILDGSFKYCRKDLCQIDESIYTLKKAEALKNPYYKKIIENNITEIESPKQIDLAYDSTCNLKCPSCRDNNPMQSEKDKIIIQKYHDKIFGDKNYLQQIEKLILTCVGDPFSNSTYRNFLQENSPEDYPNLKIWIMTNGLLLDEKMWNSLKMKKAISDMFISVDAAASDTYKKVRGGDFNKLLENLNFIGKLRKTKEIPFLELSFVVQKNNYKEMKEFVLLAKETNADVIFFQKILPFGIYANDKNLLVEIEVNNKNHPEHQQFIEILKDPIFKDPNVNIGAFKNLL